MWNCLRVCALLLSSFFILFLSRSRFVCCCDSLAGSVLATAELHSSFPSFFSSEFFILVAHCRSSVLSFTRITLVCNESFWYLLLHINTHFICVRENCRASHSFHSFYSNSFHFNSVFTSYLFFVRVSHSLSSPLCMSVLFCTYFFSRLFASYILLCIHFLIFLIRCTARFSQARPRTRAPFSSLSHSELDKRLCS